MPLYKAIYGPPVTIGSGSSLNIAYGNTPPTDTSKLWVPLAKKPSNVEIGMYSLESAEDYIDTKDAKLPVATYGTTSVEIGGKIYIFGGQASDARKQILVYDPATDTIATAKRTVVGDDGSTTEEDVVFPANCYYAAAVAINGKAYIFGGYNAIKTMYVYDPASGEVVTKEDTLKTAVQNASAVAINGKAYILGGQTSSSHVKTIQEYDPDTGECSTKNGTFPSSIYDTAAVAINGKAYIFGGSGSSSYLTSIHEYDPFSDVCRKLDTVLLDGLSKGCAVAINGKAYIFGGQITGTGREDMIQEYDPITDTIAEKPKTLASVLSNASAAVVNGKAYIFGGNTGSSSDAIQEYTPKAHLGENNAKVTATVATNTDNGVIVTNIVNRKNEQLKMRVLSVFAGDGDGYATEKTAYVYNTKKGVWQDLTGNNYYSLKG